MLALAVSMITFTENLLLVCFRKVGSDIQRLAKVFTLFGLFLIQTIRNKRLKLVCVYIPP